MSVELKQPTLKDFKGDTSTWCPGCGHFSVMAGLQRALVNLGIHPHEVITVTGIGCSSKISEYTRTYGFHTIHGRALPVAQGAKMAAPEMHVIAAGGDGDGYGIGAGHFVHAVRRNIDLTYLVMDNSIYGLTKGQTSPRSQHDFVSKTTIKGNKEYPLDALSIAIANGATFVAQAFSGDVKRMTEMIEKAIQHKGFSLVNIFSPCVTYNKVNTYDYYRDHLVTIDEPLSTREEAIRVLKEHGGNVQGILFVEERDDFQKQLGIDWKMRDIENGPMDEQMIRELEKEFM
ncbi:MAG: 2-oxoacid:ferredoxin oxidoreductase subunit beta [Candidatus Carbobacillus altaicus]|uniref:2-oxoglutarate oxidoreductase, beta subunit n=1 Tax=Candidatus Carbonibacillus altaicus TaxID=2163959 RepID=A0A2R6Y009_9BACL|nr:2-oxoacid:ferredoxin oxidoreductase subunit beta [Candidatus Carbobacillus altaicus]PTQ56009.1 MAG: 2-oxoglutarate oxidoreductase, beta subunit [Candidatus Carbobacillus altaicus]